MSDYLYERFLEDRAVYVAARAFWFKQVRLAFPHWDHVPQYLTDRFGNGELFYDGNPIFNTINYRTNRAIRIVQESPDRFGNFYTSFHEERGASFLVSEQEVMIIEKVFVLTLTRDSLTRVRQDLFTWLQG